MVVCKTLLGVFDVSLRRVAWVFLFLCSEGFDYYFILFVIIFLASRLYFYCDKSAPELFALTPNFSPRKEKGKRKKKRLKPAKKKEEEKNWKEKGHANNNKTSIYLRLPNSSTAVHTRSPIVILSTCSPAPTILAVAVAAPMSREENALIVWYVSSALCRFPLED